MSQLFTIVRYCRGLAIFIPLLCTACGELSYYSQAIRGHAGIMRGRQPIERLLALDTTSFESKERLKETLAIRNFASEVLFLPDNDSYRSFNELKRDYVVWNVFAAPEFSTELMTWCFPITGCLPYRGYFNKNSAQEYARELEALGHDVYVGGVSAYSTLGWFADPVLDTMLIHGMTWAARIIFHELAHQKLYIQDDTELNEAFADTVANIGVEKWLQHTRQNAEYESFQEQLVREADFHALIMEYRDKYQKLYASDRPVNEKRQGKEELHRDMHQKYQRLKIKWGNHSEYDAWFSAGPNNAHIGTITTYRDLAPLLKKLYLDNDSDIRRFYEAVQLLTGCEREERRIFLGNIHSGLSCLRTYKP
jgi:predicted aminopeptidase